MRTDAVLFCVLVLVALPAAAPAQAPPSPGGFGVGPRFSFVRGDASVPDSTRRLMGGLLRARLSPRTAVELSIDYRSRLNQQLTERTTDYPFQGSLLLYPVRSAVSGYLLGGLGWHSQRVDTLNHDLVVSSTTTRKMGYHAGIGGELQLGRRVAVHADYRYTFIRFGAPANEGEPGALPIPGLTPLQERLKLSHQGSMWTMGMAVYF